MLLRSELCGSLMALTAEDAGRRPAGKEGQSCIQEIVEHLLLTYDSLVESLEVRLTAGAPALARATLRERLAQVYVLDMGRFPHGRTASGRVSPTAFVDGADGRELIRRVEAGLLRLDEVVDRAKVLFGGSPALRHGLLGPLPVDRLLEFHQVHGRHHIRQILDLREQGEDPAGPRPGGERESR
jgi:hypothetical protein